MKQLRYLLKDEKKAPGDYRKLIKRLRPGDRLKIKKIIKQEQNHYKVLNKLKKKYA